MPPITRSMAQQPPQASVQFNYTPDFDEYMAMVQQIGISSMIEQAAACVQRHKQQDDPTRMHTRQMGQGYGDLLHFDRRNKVDLALMEELRTIHNYAIRLVRVVLNNWDAITPIFAKYFIADTDEDHVKGVLCRISGDQADDPTGSENLSRIDWTKRFGMIVVPNATLPGGEVLLQAEISSATFSDTGRLLASMPVPLLDEIINQRSPVEPEVLRWSLAALMVHEFTHAPHIGFTCDVEF